MTGIVLKKKNVGEWIEQSGPDGVLDLETAFGAPEQAMIAWGRGDVRGQKGLLVSSGMQG
jgi:hypothetical protein